MSLSVCAFSSGMNASGIELIICVNFWCARRRIGKFSIFGGSCVECIIFAFVGASGIELVKFILLCLTEDRCAKLPEIFQNLASMLLVLVLVLLTCTSTRINYMH